MWNVFKVNNDTEDISACHTLEFLKQIIIVCWNIFHPLKVYYPPPTPHTRVMLMNFDFCSSKKILQSLKLQDNEENSPELLYSNTCDD